MYSKRKFSAKLILLRKHKFFTKQNSYARIRCTARDDYGYAI